MSSSYVDYLTHDKHTDKQMINETDINTFIVIIGNDGTGKSTIVKKINEKYTHFYALERSTKPDKKFEEYHNKIKFKQIDALTLMTTVKESYTDYEFIDNLDGKRVCYIVIDGDIPVLVERVNKRTGEEKGMFEQEKSLIYFQQRFLAIAAFFGFPVVKNDNRSIDDTVDEIIRLISSNEYEQINSCRLKGLNYDTIHSRLYENIIDCDVVSEEIKDKIIKLLPAGSFLNAVYDNFVNDNDHKNINCLSKSLIKRYVANNITDFDESVLGKSEPYFRLVTEGESKQVFEILSKNKYLNFYIIVLKPTIYSHSKQACGEIKDLEKTRASGTQLILEMLWRNNCKHTYYAMNNFGVAHSRIIETTPIEIVFKKYCIGTDKHSYYNMNIDQNCVIPETSEYKGGPYVRFDWRNPNQVRDGIQLNTHPFYYLLESFVGKEKFFDAYLKHEKPWGDKAVAEDVLYDIFDVDECKKMILRVYNTIQYYCGEVGLEAKDGCFMIDSKNERIWSEINPDCMRIVGTDGTLYDKDIWRAQGDEAKKGVVNQWNSFNRIFTEYFDSHPFIQDDLSPNEIYNYKFQYQIKKTLEDKRLNISKRYMKFYSDLLADVPTATIDVVPENKYKKDVVFTIDMYDTNPVLVQRGKVYTTHSNGNVYEALERISVANNVFIADLNGAIDNEKNVNRNIIKDIATKCHIYTGGGIRSIEDVQELLESSCRRVTVSTVLDFLKDLPLQTRRNRLIVELSINEHNKIMTHGRKITTDIDILDKIAELIDLNITAISITFHQSEGMMNGLARDQISYLIPKISKDIEKIFIAGGVSSVDDLHFLWSFPRVIPQLGSVVWKDILTVGEIISEMGRYDERGLIPAIIQSTTGKILGLVYMNKESIKKTVDTKEFWRYSRQHKKLIKKGEESGHVQKVIHISYDCDNDSLLVTVESGNPFCHLTSGGKHCLSCFNSQHHKFNTEIVNKWVEKSDSKYTTMMKKFPGLSYAKLLEEIDELWASKECGHKYLVEESSDVYIHFLMFLNSINVSQTDLMNELGRRHYDPKLIQTTSHKTYDNKNSESIVIGITGDKYTHNTDKFIVENFGIQIIRGTGRNLEIKYVIVDQQKYNEHFGTNKVSFIGLKPKDMTRAVIYKLLHSVVTYNVTLDNLPTVFNTKVEHSDNDISLCLIKRSDKLVNPFEWTPVNKGVIATEHTTSVTKYFTKKGISPDCYSLHKLLGSSESFLVNKTDVNYDLCDAIVSSGQTLKENNLEIFDIVENPEDIKVVYAEMVTI